MVSFIAGLSLGTLIGVTIMCLLQINRYEEIERDSREEK